MGFSFLSKYVALRRLSLTSTHRCARSECRDGRHANSCALAWMKSCNSAVSSDDYLDATSRNESDDNARSWRFLIQIIRTSKISPDQIQLLSSKFCFLLVDDRLISCATWNVAAMLAISLLFAVSLQQMIDICCQLSSLCPILMVPTRNRESPLGRKLFVVNAPCELQHWTFHAWETIKVKHFE